MGASPSLYDRPKSIDHPPKPVLQPIAPTKAIGKRKVILLGLDNSGKTTFVSQLARPLHEAIGGIPAPRPTINMEVTNNDQYNLQIIDLAGRIEDRSIWEPMIIEKDVILFFIDTTEQKHRRIEEIDVWIDTLVKYIKQNPTKLLYFIGAKADIECESPMDWSTRKITLRKLNCQNGKMCHVFMKDVIRQLNAIVREYEKVDSPAAVVADKKAPVVKTEESVVSNTFCRWPW